MATAEPRIFVNIASYRDTECQWTVKDMFEKALNPDRVFAGICWQFVPKIDDDCFKVETRPEQVRVKEFHAKESRGVCWARNHAQKLWRGEEFTLQIDSHMRFAPEWDRHLLEMYEECGSPQSVLTTYPIPYEPPDKLSGDAIVTILPKFFDQHGILMFSSIAKGPKDSPATPQPTAFIAAGFLFGPARIIEDVPYDPHIYFQGEEITLATRLWTHGWDLFSPSRVVIYHDYTNRADRVRHWKDDVDWGKLNQRSMARVRHLLGVEPCDDPEALVALDQYGLGDVRTLADYEAFSGIDFANQSIHGKRAKGPAAQGAPEETERRRKIFTAIWEQNGWRCEETRSGAGATMAETVVVRDRLPGLFKDLGIETLGDAGCGEATWIPHITGGLRTYLGVDIVLPLIQELQHKAGRHGNHRFECLDLAAAAMPKCDAILCRDCLTHFSPNEAFAAVKRFKESKSGYLIATTHPKGQNHDIDTGAWHAMDLTAAPFNFPPPDILIDEQLPRSSKSLGVWKIENLPDL